MDCFKWFGKKRDYVEGTVYTLFKLQCCWRVNCPYLFTYFENFQLNFNVINKLHLINLAKKRNSALYYFSSRREYIISLWFKRIREICNIYHVIAGQIRDLPRSLSYSGEVNPFHSKGSLIKTKTLISWLLLTVLYPCSSCTNPKDFYLVKLISLICYATLIVSCTGLPIFIFELKTQIQKSLGTENLRTV